jgi:hypothetical protein
MVDKKLLIMGAVAAVLAGTAYITTSNKKVSSPSLAGKSILPSFNVADLSTIEIGGDKPLSLSLGDKGWKVDTLFGYPADISKIRENILKLKDLKVGQVANGMKIEKPVLVDLQDKNGKSLASLSLGSKHMRKATGQAAMFGGGSFPDGRYVLFKDKTVLVNDSLSGFDGDPKSWVDTSIVSVPASEVEKVSYFAGSSYAVLTRDGTSWKLDGLSDKEELDSSKLYGVDSVLSHLNFTDIASSSKAETYGFSTGAVYAATLKNGISYMANIGNASGDGKYMRISSSFKPMGTNVVENAKLEKAVKDFNAKVGNWVFVVSSYSASSMSKKRSDFVKAKEAPGKEAPEKEPSTEEKK